MGDGFTVKIDWELDDGDMTMAKQVARRASGKALTAARKVYCDILRIEAPDYGDDYALYVSDPRKKGRKPTPGWLKASFREFKRNLDDDPAWCTFGTSVWYAPWVEFGTHEHLETSEKGMWWPPAGPVSKEVHHPGQFEHPFFRVSIAQGGPEAAAAIAAVFFSAFEKFDVGPGAVTASLDTAVVDVEGA